MIVHQQWHANKVHAWAMVHKHQGVTGWTVFEGSYDPKLGQTSEQADWKILGTMMDFVPAVETLIVSRLAALLADQGKPIELCTLLSQLHTICVQIKAP